MLSLNGKGAVVVGHGDSRHTFHLNNGADDRAIFILDLSRINLHCALLFLDNQNNLVFDTGFTIGSFQKGGQDLRESLSAGSCYYFFQIQQILIVCDGIAALLFNCRQRSGKGQATFGKVDDRFLLRLEQVRDEQAYQQHTTCKHNSLSHRNEDWLLDNDK